VPAVFGFLQHRPGAAVGKKKRYKKRQIYILVLTIDRLVFFQLQDTPLGNYNPTSTHQGTNWLFDFMIKKLVV
jgi:hypothetical protein